MLDQYRIADSEGGRRSHRRVNARFSMHCRRLGRTGFDETVEAVDLSPGGVRFLIDGRLITGDVVLMTLDIDAAEVQFKGLVVHSSVNEENRRQAHVAFTGISGSSQEALAELLERNDESVTQAVASDGHAGS
jgi:hypothetical protein